MYMGSSMDPVKLKLALEANHKLQGCVFKVSAVLQAFDENE